MNRRGFLAGILACSVPPDFVHSESLMGLYVPKKTGLLVEVGRGRLQQLNLRVTQELLEHAQPLLKLTVFASPGLLEYAKAAYPDAIVRPDNEMFTEAAFRPRPLAPARSAAPSGDSASLVFRPRRSL